MSDIRIKYDMSDIRIKACSDTNDLHAPLITKIVTIRPDTAWYTKGMWFAKTLRRKLERCWRKTGLDIHRAMYKDQCGVVGRPIWDAKKNYYERVLNELPSNQSKLFSLSRRLFGLNNHECANHNLSVNANASEAFSKFFIEKVMVIVYYFIWLSQQAEAP